MKAFGASRRLSEEDINATISVFEDVAYTPDIMGEVNSARLKELTGLAKGHTIALRKFARQWCGKIETKRAHR